MAASNVWVFMETERDGFEEVSLEILGQARRLADRHGHRITAVVLGSDPSNPGKEAIGYGADSAICLKHEKLAEFGTDLYTAALSRLATERRPDTILVGATNNGRDLAARLAARLRTGLAANVVTLDLDEEGKLYSGVPGYGSKVIARILCVKNKPQMSTVRPGIFSSQEFNPERHGEVEIIEPELDGLENRVSVISRITEDSKDITGSERVIVAGNGAGGEIPLVEKLGEVIGADIGATRPLADRGLYPREVQVGSTGISLKAKYAVILGSSGSEHFITGIANCRTVISIDVNPDSDIFEYSDYCIVGDVAKLLPELIRIMEAPRQ